MIILVDQDDTIADFNGEFARRWKEKHPDKLLITPEEQKSFTIAESYPPDYLPFIREIYLAPGFVENLPPISGAIEALREMRAEGHDVFICTAPLTDYENCVLEKYRWTEKHLGKKFTPKMILTRDKTLVHGHVLIDDRPRILGVKSLPDWKHILFDAPYNRDLDKPRLKDWKNWREVILK